LYKAIRRQQFEKITALLEIEPLLHRGVGHLSGGEKIRVAMARAILGNPRWLLLDEPFSGLDQALKDQIVMYLRRLHQAIAIPMVLVSHCPDEIVDLVDEVIFMEGGRQIARGILSPGGTGGSGCFCRSQNTQDLQKIKNWLMRNHSLQLDVYRKSLRVV
jgi:molybdate transport system ATP-binding protein